MMTGPTATTGNDAAAATMTGTKSGNSTSTSKATLPRQGGALLGLQKWGTQHPQHNYNGGCCLCDKNGGLNVHNESITAQARGDTTWAKMGDSTHIFRNYYRRAIGGSACGTKNGGLDAHNHNKGIVTWARGDAS